MWGELHPFLISQFVIELTEDTVTAAELHKGNAKYTIWYSRYRRLISCSISRFSNSLISHETSNRYRNRHAFHFGSGFLKYTFSGGYAKIPILVSEEHYHSDISAIAISNYVTYFPTSYSLNLLK